MCASTSAHESDKYDTGEVCVLDLHKNLGAHLGASP